MAGRVLLRQPQLLPTSGCLCSVPFRVRAAKSRHCSPIYAQPANGGREESGSGWSDQRDPSGLDDELRVDPGLELAANSWPRIILDEPRQQTGEMPSPEPPLRAADKARRREAALLRLATLGFAAVLVGERLTGHGVVQALGHPTGIPLAEMDIALGLLAGALLVGGLVPTSYVYASVNEEVPGLFEDIPALIGRASCVMLALTIIAEVITGKGALGLLSVETGTEYISEIEGGFIFILLLFITNTKKPSSS